MVLGVSRIASASAITLTTAEGNGADSFVSNDGNQSATSTHGGDGSLAIRNYDTVRAKATYLRFDLSGVTGDLSAATLTVDFTGANRARTMNVYGLTDESGDNWDESSMSYTTAPGIVQPADGGAAYNSGSLSLDSSKLTTVASFTTPSAPAVATTSASVNLDNFLASDTNKLITLVLFTASSDSSQSYFVASKENTTADAVIPTLTFPNATSVPDPAALSVLGLGAMALVRRRKQRLV
jgi:MYXO-CTERM domain-containing protein